MPVLKYESDDGDTAEIVLDSASPRVEIGRGKTCAICTSSHSVSRVHAEVCLEDGVVVLRDLGSSNGSFYAGARIETAVIELNTRFYCGKFEVSLLADPGPNVGASQEVDFGGAASELASSESGELEELPSFQGAESDGDAAGDGAVDTSSLPMVDLAVEPPPLPGDEPLEDVEEPAPDLSGELEEVVGELARLTAEHDELKEQLRAAVEERGAFEEAAQELQETERSLDEVTVARDAAVAECGALRAVRDSYQVDLENAEELLETAISERDDVQGQLESLRESLEKLEASLGGKSEAIEALESAVETRDEDMARLREQLTDRDAQLEQARGLTEEAESRVAVLETRSEEAAHERDKEVEARDAAARAADERIEELTAALSQGETSAGEAAERIETLESALDGLKEDARSAGKVAKEREAGLLAELEMSKTELVARADAVDGVREAAGEVESRLREELSGVQAQLKELRQVLESSIGPSEARELSDRLEESEKAGREANAALARLQTDADASAARKSEEENRAQSAQVLADEIEERAERLTAENAELKGMLVGAALADEAAALQERIALLETEVTAREAQAGLVAEVGVEAEGLRVALRESEEARRALEDELAASEKVRATVTKDAQKLEARSDKLKAGHGESQAKLKQAAKESSRLQKALSALETEMEERLEAAGVSATELATLQGDLAAQTDELAESRTLNTELSKERDAALKSAKDADAALQAADADSKDAARGALELARVQEELQGLMEEHQSVQIAHKRSVKSAATHLDRIETLESQLSESADDLAARTSELAELHERLKSDADQELRARGMEKSLEEAQEELGNLRAAHAATQAELAQAIQNADQRDSGKGSEAYEQEIAERVAESEALAQDKARLEDKLSRMREALDSMENESPAALKESVQTLYEDVNDIASAWKNDLALARDHFDEIEEGFADSEQRDATHESLRELLESLAAASVDVKDRLKAFRGLIED